jgi:SnoaL-like polyketide cyclase
VGDALGGVWENAPVRVCDDTKRGAVGDDLAAEGDRVYARPTLTDTNTGRFFGVPPTGRPYKGNMFDYARFEDGRIVERVQQSDTLSQLGQMYGGAAKKAAAVAAAGLVGAALLALRGRRRRRTGRPRGRD